MDPDTNPAPHPNVMDLEHCAKHSTKRFPLHLHNGSLRRVECVGLEGGPLVALLIGRADGVRPVGEKGRARHSRHRPPAPTAQVGLRAIRGFNPAVIGAARRAAGAQEQGILEENLHYFGSR
jgi:hypothetical protein